MGRGIFFAIAAAVLFGTSTPVSKVLLGQGISPWLLAGLLYLGSGFGLALVTLSRRAGGISTAEARIARQDLGWLTLVVFFGGILGPLLLMLGLTTTGAAPAALLLNVEGLATMAIAWLVFKENVDRRLLLGAAAVVAGAVVLSWQSGATDGISIGALAIIGACVAWGIDNNLTRKIASADPVQLALVKGVVAGATNLAIALSFGAALPPADILAVAAVVGFLGYGVSLVFFIVALRHLGSARTGAYFSTAPFAGALIAIAFLGESVTVQLVAAGILMAIGLYFHVTEVHEHEHQHEALEHDHRHVHDEHHLHGHLPGDPRGEPHAHRHSHVPLGHRHRHFPDLHHRHRH